MKTIEKARFDTRLAKEQKEYFEYVANLGGFRNLTEFIIFSAEQQAVKIVQSYNVILTSKRDREIFFNAMMKPAIPNNQLKKAVKHFKEVIEKK